MRTLAFEGSGRAEVWVGPAGSAEPGEAWARLSMADGDLIVRAAGARGILMPGIDEALSGPIALDARVPTMFGLLAVGGHDTASVLVRPASDGMRMFVPCVLASDASFLVGRDPESDIVYENAFVSARHAKLSWSDGTLSIQDLRSGNGTWVNGNAIAPLQPRTLLPGDVAQIVDLVLVVGLGFLSVNQPEGLVSLPADAYRSALIPRVGAAGAPVPVAPRFYPSPRLTEAICPLRLAVEPPPARHESDEQSVLMEMGPSFFMGIGAVAMAAAAISRMGGGADPMTTVPSVAMAVAMVAGSLLWPVVSHAYERRRQAAVERRRADQYVGYLDDVARAFEAAVRAQSSALEEAHPSVQELLRRTACRSPQLMSRLGVHDDFMELRVGTGSRPPVAEVSWPAQRILVGHDVLWDKLRALRDRAPMLDGVPITCDMRLHPMVGVMGPREKVWEFVRGLVVQTIALHSHREAKVALVACDDEREEWEFLTRLAHHRDDVWGGRLVALTDEGLRRLDRVLEREVARREESGGGTREGKLPHILVVCADQVLGRRSETLGRLSMLSEGMGITLLVMAERLSELPRECGCLIDLGSGDIPCESGSDDRVDALSCMFERSDVRGTLVRFVPDIMVSRVQALDCARSLAPLRLDMADERHEGPACLGFLELYQVGDTSQLDVCGRWSRSDASRALGVPVGVDEHGLPIALDLHESAHGPHGLIAGTTGSGKSEFIVTFVTSLCVAYPPNEVAVVLIDYKGGGLVDAFDNARMRLPHLAGTITNLDGGEIGRCLRSVRSELKRRQRVLRQARESTGEAAMDIYRYLSLYRQGIVDEPLPHLVIVADEFAELKQQRPEFMDELMSAARIGRSLGVHLILATQKPTGVVNEQIWSNSRFKVSLKVSERADSREMVRRDDAAHFSRPGEFCLLVGYDEYFVHGQAAYAGCDYVPREQFEPRRELAVEALGSEGEVIMRAEASRRGRGDRSELDAVLAEISVSAESLGQRAQTLWLDPLPACVTLGETERIANERSVAEVPCVVGLLDDPDDRRQDPYVLDLVKTGNVMLYGAQGSGVERVLRAMLVSMAPVGFGRESWVYAVDLGTGLLPGLAALPNVGGVLRVFEEDGIDRLLRMLERRLEGAETAETHDGVHVVLAVANLGALLELRQDYLDRLVKVTRDGAHCGIHVFATVERAHAVPLRLQANFDVNLAFRLNDEMEYSALVGGTQNLGVPRHPSRGLVRLGGRVLSFQGVSLAEEPDDEPKEIARRADAARGLMRGVPERVPMLPANVWPESVRESCAFGGIPVGFDKLDARPCVIDATRGTHVLVLGNDADAVRTYLRGVFEAVEGQGTLFVDTRGSLGLPTCPDRLMTSVSQVMRVLGRVERGESTAPSMVFCDVVGLLEDLGDEGSGLFARCITGTGRNACPTFVLAAEHWQVCNRYDEWFRVVCGQGTGAWVGPGFAEQTVFPLSRVLPAYRAPLSAHDGFLVSRGAVRPVRFVQPREAMPS